MITMTAMTAASSVGGQLNIVWLVVAVGLVVAVTHKFGIGDEEAVVAPPAGREDELAASGSGARQ